MTKSARPVSPVDEKASRKAALVYEKEELQRKRAREKEEAELAKQKARQEKATARAQASFDKSEREHGQKIAALDKQRETIEKQIQAEDARWHKKKERLSAAIRKAKS